MKAWNVPTSWKNRHDLVDMLDYGQFSYICEMGSIESEHSTTEPGHFSLDIGRYGQSDMTLRLAGEKDADKRRVVWFPCDEHGTPQQDPSSMEQFCNNPSQTTSNRYELLLKNFVGTDWSDDANVLAFYERYGPLWVGSLFREGLGIYSESSADNGRRSSNTVMRGESVYMATLQARLVSVVLRIRAAISPAEDDDTRFDAARRMAVELRDSFGIQKRKPFPYTELSMPKPGGSSGWGFSVSLGNAANPDCSGLDVTQQLQWIAVHIIDTALQNVELHLDRLTDCEKSSQNYGTPVLRYRPKNLIGLIYLLLAMIMVMPDDCHCVRYCPVCGDVFFPQKSHCAWHKSACRMRIERSLRGLGVCTKGLTPQEKVRSYQETRAQQHQQESRPG